MSVFDRLLRSNRDPREGLRPLWHRIVGASRAERWYREGGVADNVAGRFDMIATILALVLLRLERADAPPEPGVLLTELFVEDMDRQLRETGVGDLMVGKQIGKLLSVLGGRLGAFRTALAPATNEEADPHPAPEHDQALVAAADRNTTLAEGRDAAALAGLLRAYDRALEALTSETILAGQLPD